MQTEATNAQKLVNATKKASAAVSESRINTTAVKQAAVDKKLRSGRQITTDTSKPVMGSVPPVATSRQQVWSKCF